MSPTFRNRQTRQMPRRHFLPNAGGRYSPKGLPSQTERRHRHRTERNPHWQNRRAADPHPLPEQPSGTRRLLPCFRRAFVPLLRLPPHPASGKCCRGKYPPDSAVPPEPHSSCSPSLPRQTLRQAALRGHRCPLPPPRCMRPRLPYHSRTRPAPPASSHLN